ncbi:MAG: HXXEE domain-containing protein [Acidobacteriia bacterium]|nr:HXXEE domain-containing protein [Terriglobia bacterium]
MKPLVDWFMGLDFRKAIWLAPLVWTLHEAEEWNINNFESRHFADPGHFSLIDHPVLWIGLGLVASYGIIWTALTAWPRNPKFAAFLTLPFFVYLSFGNVLQHIYWTLFFRTYAPGVVTAVLLVAPVVIGLTVKAIRGKLIPWWYAAILYLLLIPTVVSTVRAANQTPPQLPPQLTNAIKRTIPLARSILGRHD